MRPVLIGILSVVLLAVGVRAQEPTTRPDRRPPGEPGRRLTGEEILQGRRFAEEHMPALYKLASDLPRSPRKMRLWHYAATRQRAWQEVRNNPEHAAQLTKELAAEDAVFAVVAELEAAPPEQRDAIRQKLLDRTTALVDNLLNERARRIERLKARLAEEERKLEEDRTNQRQIIEERIRRFTENPTTRAAEGEETTAEEQPPQPEQQQ